MKILVATKKVRYCGTAGVYKGKKHSYSQYDSFMGIGKVLGDSWSKKKKAYLRPI
jgi:hypothetical protein